MEHITWNGDEQILYPDSLEIIIAGIKKKTSGNHFVAKSYDTFFKNDERGIIAINTSIYAFNYPTKFLLILAEPKDG